MQNGFDHDGVFFFFWEGAGCEKGGGVGGQGLQRKAVFFRAERPWWFGVVSSRLGELAVTAAVPGVLYCIHGPIRGRDGGQPGGRGGGGGSLGPSDQG